MEKPTILICTPDRGLKEILSSALCRNHNCVFHTDAYNLTIKAQGAKASIIIIDLGFDYSHIKNEIVSVKAYPTLKGISVMLLSNHDNNNKILKDTKADYILSKPFAISELADVVNKDDGAYRSIKQKNAALKLSN
jgi:DNA-binding response OmpR family regulator